MQKGSPSINLLRNREVNFLDKFINWTLTIGRAVVIVTELIALSAFIYRFSLDRQLIDLHSKINQEKAIVGSLKDRENTYRNLQDRLAIASKFADIGKKEVKIFKDVAGLTPQGVTFNDISISLDRIKIDANAQSVTSLTSFISSLKNYPGIVSVSIDRIENKTSSAIIAVSITAVLKNYGITNQQ